MVASRIARSARALRGRPRGRRVASPFSVFAVVTPERLTRVGGDGNVRIKGHRSASVGGVLPDDPVALFQTWLGQAEDADLPEPRAVVLATVDGRGRPSARVVLHRRVED